jgi:hypothetical protein
MVLILKYKTKVGGYIFSRTENFFFSVLKEKASLHYVSLTINIINSSKEQTIIT